MRIAIDEIVAEGRNAVALQTLAEIFGSRLTVEMSYDYRAYHESEVLEFAT